MKKKLITKRDRGMSNVLDSRLSKREEFQALSKTIINYLLKGSAYALESFGVVGSGIAFGFWTEFQNQRERIKQVNVLKELRILLHQNESRISDITNLLNSGIGFLLFSKIALLVRNSEPEDDEYFPIFSKLLARCLLNISKQNFEILFSKIHYLVSRIEKLSSQALLVLSENRDWPTIGLGGTTMNDVTLSGHWESDFARAYLESKEIADKDMIARVINVMKELEIGGYVKVSPEKRIVLTEIGKEVDNYLLNHKSL